MAKLNPKASCLLSCFNPLTSPLVGSVLVLTVPLVQPKVKDNCLWSSSGMVCVFLASISTPAPRQSFGSGAYFKACVKLYVILIKMEGSRVNWQSPTTASAKWHTEKCLATNGRAEICLSSNMQAHKREVDSGHVCLHSLGASRIC